VVRGLAVRSKGRLEAELAARHGQRRINKENRLNLQKQSVGPNGLGEPLCCLQGENLMVLHTDTAPTPVERRQILPRLVIGVWTARAGELMPGLVLTFGIAGIGFALSRLPYMSTFSPLILSIILGMLFHNGVGTPARCSPGAKFSLRRILRFAIILLGFRLTLDDVMAVGGAGLGVVMLTLAATFGFTVWLGRRLGVDAKLSQLIAAGTSVCGASAVIATNTVTEGSDEDVAYAVACVTVFGSLAMLLQPALSNLLHLDSRAFGLWAGASIHEIAQVIAAAFQDSREAGDLATIAKLSRVMLLAPLVILLGVAASRARRHVPNDHGPASRSAAPFPWFVIGFLAMIGFNSLDLLPHEQRASLVEGTTFLLSVALAAMGLETDVDKLKAKGLRPLLLGAGAWVFIAGFSLLLVQLVYA
jgi:uncharacterized integral membrane protein (TIGR00698 family)